MFQKACKTLGYMEIIVFKIAHGGAKPYLSHDLYRMEKYFGLLKFQILFWGSCYC